MTRDGTGARRRFGPDDTSGIPSACDPEFASLTLEEARGRMLEALQAPRVPPTPPDAPTEEPTPHEAVAFRSRCPIARALDVIGDAWTLLIIRDVLFRGSTRFSDFSRAREGIAPAVLAGRLRRLVALDLLRMEPDPADSRWSLYLPTARACDLAPVLLELIVYGAVHLDGDVPRSTMHEIRVRRRRWVDRLRGAWARQNAELLHWEDDDARTG